MGEGCRGNWHLPVIRIIIGEWLLHFGFGNDADGTCHATRLRAALLVTKILHDDRRRRRTDLAVPHTSNTCSSTCCCCCCCCWYSKRANMRLKSKPKSDWLTALAMQINHTPKTFQYQLSKIYRPVSTRFLLAAAWLQLAGPSR